MQRSVELELEEVDRIAPDDALLRKANVSPFFTSTKPHMLLLTDLEFSPSQAGAKNGAAAGTIPPLTLDSYGVQADADNGQLKRSASWVDSVLGRAQFKQADWNVAKTDAPVASRREAASAFGSSLLYDDGRQEGLDCIPSLYEDDFGHRPDAAGGRASFVSHAPALDAQFRAQSTDARHARMGETVFPSRATIEDTLQPSPFKLDEVNALSPTAIDKKVIVTENDLKLFTADSMSLHNMRAFYSRHETAPTSSTGLSDHRRLHQNASPFELTATPGIPRLRREKLFPQEDHSFYNHHAAEKRARMMEQMRRFLPAELSELRARNRVRSDIVNSFKARSSMAHGSPKRFKYPARLKPRAIADPRRHVIASPGGFVHTVRPGVIHPDAARFVPLRKFAGMSSVQASPSLHREHHQPMMKFPNPWKVQSGHPSLLTRMPTPTAKKQHNAPVMPQKLANLLKCSYTSDGIPIPTRKIGAYSPEARIERIRRFNDKRKLRVFHKRIKYACRKRLATACPRIKGRFVKKTEYLEALKQEQGQEQEQESAQSDETAPTELEENAQEACAEAPGASTDVLM